MLDLNMISKTPQFIKQLPKWLLRSLFFGFGLLMFIFNDAFGSKEPYLTIALVYFLCFFILLGYWSYKQVKRLITLKQERRKAELKHLKSQVNPHFFFNTLNNLYGLVDEDTERTKELILQLSDMMSYSIYKGEQEFVALNEEVEYLQNYIKLHQIRYHKKIDITFNVHLKDNSIQVMPLLFIILLENAFKHGVENLISNAYIHLKLSDIPHGISFEIENNFDPEEVNQNPGIGLENLKRRLELAYPKKHNLTINQTNTIYKAVLTITLK